MPPEFDWRWGKKKTRLLLKYCLITKFFFLDILVIIIIVAGTGRASGWWPKIRRRPRSSNNYTVVSKDEDRRGYLIAWLVRCLWRREDRKTGLWCTPRWRRCRLYRFRIKLYYIFIIDIMCVIKMRRGVRRTAQTLRNNPIRLAAGIWRGRRQESCFWSFDWRAVATRATRSVQCV